MTTPRIISLIASSTEIVAALGYGDHLVGRSHECDYPPTVTALPVCTEPKFNPDGSSAEIDQRVKEILEKSLSVYRVHSEQLEALQPDVIITQSQCEVCAVSLKEVEAAVCELVSSNPQIVSLEPNSLSDVWADIRRVATALGDPAQGEALVAGLQGRMRTIAEQAQWQPNPPTVACIEWIEPLMAAGNWMPELVEIAGGKNLFGEAGHHSPWMTWEALVEADPDLILILPCGYDITTTRQNMSALTGKPEWANLNAVKEECVFVIDGNQYFNRPGPRLAESLEILAEIFYPEEFDFGHQGRGWEYF